MLGFLNNLLLIGLPTNVLILHYVEFRNYSVYGTINGNLLD